MQPSFVYILASRKVGTLYVGVTTDLIKRVSEHKQNIIRGFTTKYNVHHLVYYETYPHLDDAILRENRLKSWKRAWKIQLIEKENPNWDDIFLKLVG